METRQAIANRIRELCMERGLTPNAISNISAAPQATAKSVLNGESKNPGTVTMKKSPATDLKLLWQIFLYSGI